MHYNCVIIGAGAVGSTLAIALAKLNYRVLVLDKKELPPLQSNSKTIALSYASYAILSALEVWPHFDSPIPIRDVLVTVKGAFGSTCLNQKDKQPLGFVLGLPALEHGLAKAMLALENIIVLRPQELRSFQRNEKWHLEIPGQDRVSCDLLVSAEGIYSSLRDAHFIQVQKKDYGHIALVCQVQLDKQHENLAYERFLPQGTIALLPWYDDQFTLVWSLSQDKAQQMKALSDADFITNAQAALGHRLGKIQQVFNRNSFPLQMQMACNQSGSRFLLIGNSAHSLHPIAAQGLNLSLRDIWQIRSQILKSAQFDLDLGSTAFLEEYIQARAIDQNKMMAMTDFLAEWVSGKMPTVLKGIGLNLFDSIKPLKKQFTYFGMGLV